MSHLRADRALLGMPLLSCLVLDVRPQARCTALGSAPGAMAEYMIFPADAGIVHPVPTSLTLRLAVYIEPLACAIHAVQRATIELGDTVVVSGCGPCAGAGDGGCRSTQESRPPHCAGPEARALTVATPCGADVALNPRETDVIAEVLGLTDGCGCDVLISRLRAIRRRWFRGCT